MTIHPLFAGTLFLMLSPPTADKPVAGPVRVTFGQMFYQQRIIIRVPRRPERAYADAARDVPVVEWREKKAASCIPIARVSAATLTKPESVDLLIEDGTRLRAHFADDCHSLDFYGGVYLRASSDGQLCAKRDVVRARSGRQCPIRNFKWVTPRYRNARETRR